LKGEAMKGSVLGAISALALGLGLSGGATGAYAADFGYDGYDESETVVTRKTVVERRIVRPERFVREEIVERPVVYAPRRIVREFVEERPVIVRPRPVVRQVFIERDGFYGPRPARFGYGGPGFDPYD